MPQRKLKRIRNNRRRMSSLTPLRRINILSNIIPAAVRLFKSNFFARKMRPAKRIFSTEYSHNLRSNVCKKKLFRKIYAWLGDDGDSYAPTSHSQSLSFSLIHSFRIQRPKIATPPLQNDGFLYLKARAHCVNTRWTSNTNSKIVHTRLFRSIFNPRRSTPARISTRRSPSTRNRRRASRTVTLSRTQRLTRSSSIRTFSNVTSWILC